MRIDKVYNANVYIDGTNSLLGRASEITLPDVAAATEEHAALGLFGKVMLPTGLEAMSIGLKWNGWYGDHVLLGANPFAAHRLQVRASVEGFGAAGRESETPLVVSLTGRWTKAPLGGLAAQTSPELEDELTCTYLKTVLGGTELVEIDVLENVWRVGGVDLLANYRKNLGG